MKSNYTIGVDFGTDSVRAILVNTADGAEIGLSVALYPRWKAGLYCDAASQRFRQHPLDYVECLELVIKDCLAQAGSEVASRVVGLSVDTTGSTPVPVDRHGTPLSLLPGFSENPNAMFVLWKDHTANQEAAEINRHAQGFDTNYLQYVGGIYSSEWFWAKILHIHRTDPAVAQAAYTWMEHCDWIPFLLTGGAGADTCKRSVCAAGHKGLWAAEFGGFPPNDFFASLDPLLDGLVSTLSPKTFDASQSAGQLSPEWAARLGLSANVQVGIGAFDCHMGAVGGQIEPYHLSKVIGTSTCDILVAPKEDMENKLVQGICGQVVGSVVPGMVGLEAGQSAFGDTYAWFKNLLAWPLQVLLPEIKGLDTAAREKLRQELESGILKTLAEEAGKIPLTEELEFAVDWLNGRRTPDANQLLSGAIYGLHLGSDAPRIFRALAEATAFGAKNIVDRFLSEGIPVRALIALGGISRKSPFVMQMMADVINMPIKIHRSEQTCALGAAMFAATIAGIYPRVEDAMQSMGQGFDQEYIPDPERAAIYAKRFRQYLHAGQFIENNLIANI